ncbi:MAG: DNA polymerase/3'-5' exonuclease PolX [Firmicutes bacterium]|mgnify:CR=1 FL=1|nr:DNA polymerase/3'-5' exonuclease PolX [Bacillota bacterium]
MKNREVAAYLQHIAELLILRGENRYKVQAFLQAARTISHLEERVEDLVAERRILEVKGIGKTLSGIIEEIVIDGGSKYLAELEAEAPVELLPLFSMSGLGPRNISLLMESLDVKNFDDLEAAAERGDIGRIPRVGASLERSILNHLERKERFGSRILLNMATDLVLELQARIGRVDGVTFFSATGETRRGHEGVSEVGILLGTDGQFAPERLEEVLRPYPLLREMERVGGKIKINSIYNVPVTIKYVPAERYFARLVLETGSGEHIRYLQKRARDLGFDWDEKGFSPGNGYPAIRSEEEIYRILDMPFIPPELREDNSLFEADVLELPSLVEIEDIKGDLHLHSDWSDGRNTIPELVERAIRKGYEYVAITDHSRSLKIAGGLTEEKLREQVSYIEELRGIVNGLHIFTGIEVDILGDGTLDFPDQVLKELDVVIASIHSGFKQSREELTGRIMSAMENPYVDIIGHPTGRLINRRDPYRIDIEQVLDHAIRTNTALEINSSPDRLDLKDEHIREAVSRGVRLVINTDAHGINAMDDMVYGVITARRGMAGRDDILNTRHAKFWRGSL